MLQDLFETAANEDRSVLFLERSTQCLGYTERNAARTGMFIDPACLTKKDFIWAVQDHIIADISGQKKLFQDGTAPNAISMSYQFGQLDLEKSAMSINDFYSDGGQFTIPNPFRAVESPLVLRRDIESWLVDGAFQPNGAEVNPVAASDRRFYQEKYPDTQLKLFNTRF
jgi:hypothetical protein